MTTLAIRKKIADYMQFADEKKVKAIYTLVRADIEIEENIYTPQFKKELEKRYADYKSGKAKMVTAAESKKRILKILKK
jgi:hypothetical protein